jgi:hypothetical protein
MSLGSYKTAFRTLVRAAELSAFFTAPYQNFSTVRA